jgi:hypothetical protein
MKREEGLRQERARILKELGGIEEMRRGSVVLQYVPRQERGKAAKAVRGPYPLFTCKRGGRTVGFRIHSEGERRRLEREVKNYHRFRRLCSRLVAIGEELSERRKLAAE